MIEAKNLTKDYGGVRALSISELHIAEGESFGLVGNNGAGKTTFFSLILDLIRPTSGMILSNGKTVMMSEHWKGYTGSYLDERFLIDFLTPEEYFEFLADIHGLSNTEYTDFLKEFQVFFNDEVLDKGKYIRDLSKGNQKKVALAAALMAHPTVLVLDEPFPHLDPSTVFRLKSILGNLKSDKQVTMLISSHDLNHVTEVCDRIVVLDSGNIIHDLPTSEETLRTLHRHFAI
ncbi:MAG: ABC transporter ATP-binding protein [Bacteroidetes bacterium]|nr:ABC transporter ATP-binding protein [Bacteroidota bacterium]